MARIEMTKQGERTKTVKRSIQQRLPNSVTDLPTSVQKSYFMLSDAERGVLNTALEKYRPGHSEAVLVGGRNVLKPALRLMTSYRLAIDEIKNFQAITIYTRWVDAVQLKRGENEEVYVTFSPSLERIWLDSKKRLLKFADKKPANIGLRSRYALRLYSWAKQYVTAGTKRISLEELRKVLGLESVRDAGGNVVREAPLAAWANFRQRALDTAIREINAKTDLHIQLKSLERSGHWRVSALIFAIIDRPVSKGIRPG
jgi:plasmid replication initiation protein